MAVFAQERQELSSYNKDHLALKVLNIYYVVLYRKSLRTLVQVGRYKTSDERSTNSVTQSRKRRNHIRLKIPEKMLFLGESEDFE